MTKTEKGRVTNFIADGEEKKERRQRRSKLTGIFKN